MAVDRERLRRAKSLEFNTKKIWYHGTDADFLEFKDTSLNHEKFAHFFSDDEEFAKLYGSRTYPSYLRVNNPKRMSANAWDALRDKYKRDPMKFLALRQKLIGEGHDALLISGKVERFANTLVRKPSIIAVFDPKNIRSINAQFSLEDSDSTLIWLPTL